MIKYPVKKEVGLTTDLGTAISRVSEHLKTEHGGHASSENAVIRRLIVHGLTCDIFLTSLSIDRKLFADLQLD